MEGSLILFQLEGNLILVFVSFIISFLYLLKVDFDSRRIIYVFYVGTIWATGKAILKNIAFQQKLLSMITYTNQIK